MTSLRSLAALAVLGAGYGSSFMVVDESGVDFYLPPDDDFQSAPQRTVFRKPKLLPPAPPAPLTKRQRRRLRGKRA